MVMRGQQFKFLDVLCTKFENAAQKLHVLIRIGKMHHYVVVNNGASGLKCIGIPDPLKIDDYALIDL